MPTNVSGQNLGPNSSKTTTLQSTLRDVGGIATLTGTLAAGTNSDFTVQGFQQGINDRLGLQGNVTTSTLGGLLNSKNVPNNFDLFLINLGSNNWNIAHQDPGSTPGNQFVCLSGNYVILAPFGGVRCRYLVNLFNTGIGYWVLS